VLIYPKCCKYRKECIDECLLVQRCRVCHGRGQVGCHVCGCQGQLKYYICLTITWKNHKSDHVVERTSLPGELIAGAQGQLAFKDEHIRVAPINDFPEPAVNQASNQLVGEHAASFFSTERVLMQVRLGRVSVQDILRNSLLDLAPIKCCRYDVEIHFHH
jgi:hypothetical protein